MVATWVCKAFDMPCSMGKQLHFLPFGLRVWGMKSKTPLAVRVLASGALHCKSSINPLCISKHSYTTHEMAPFSSSHLPDSNYWGTNSRFFINTNIYPYMCIYIRWWWLEGGLFQQWCSAAAPVRPWVLADLSLCYWNCCRTIRNMDQPPQFMLSKSPKALWDLLSSQSGTSSWIHWCTPVIVIFA